MTEAKLTFEGAKAFTGTARHGGDFVVFVTDETPTHPIETGTKGQVEIGGTSRKVSLESLRTIEQGDHSGSTEFTLRLFTPIPG